LATRESTQKCPDTEESYHNCFKKASTFFGKMQTKMYFIFLRQNDLVLQKRPAKQPFLPV